MDRKIDSFVKDGTHYFELYCQCPNCTENGKSVPPSFWYCESCGGEIYVGDNAHLLCSKCENEIPLTHAEFRYPHHSNTEHANVVFHERPFYYWNMIGVMGPLVRMVGIKWLQLMLKNL